MSDQPSRPTRRSDPVEHWASALRSRDRTALSRLLTYAESLREEHRDFVEAVIAACPPRSSFRIGISGSPGVGKSTLIDGLGMQAVESGLAVAVSTVDPSSQTSGGSLLGDKTRMSRLANCEAAFVRPAASGGVFGGLSRFTEQSLKVFDRAGFDLVLLETVGVGQSETEAVSLVDLFILVVAPQGGDDVQGLKRGITEHAELLVVNKADLGAQAANRCVQGYLDALRLLQNREVDVVSVSAKTGEGLPELWQLLAKSINERRDDRRPSFAPLLIEQRVVAQSGRLFEARLRELLAHGGPARQIMNEVKSGKLSTERAAEGLVELVSSHYLGGPT